jgi:DNA-binding MarR family transcriptional regulator
MASKDRTSLSDVQRVAEFRVALRRFEARSDLAARAAGLTPQRYLLLVAIKGAPDGGEQASVSELADRLEMPQTTVSDLVTRAEDVGLVLREPSALDGRVVHVRLTPEGDRRLADCLDSLDEDRAELERALAAATRRIRSIRRA